MKKCKWNTSAVYMMQRKFMSVRKDLNTNHSYSKEHALTPNNYVPGGALTTEFGSLSSHVVETSKTSDKLGQWNAIKIKH